MPKLLEIYDDIIYSQLLKEGKVDDIFNKFYKGKLTNTKAYKRYVYDNISNLEERVDTELRVTKKFFIFAIVSDPTTILPTPFGANNEHRRIEEVKHDQVQKIGDYVKWIMLMTRVEDNWVEDLEKVGNWLKTYNELKKNNKLNPIEKNIFNCKSFSDLYTIIQSHKDESELSKRGEIEAEKERIRKEETDYVYEDDEWLVVTPTTNESSCYWGADTAWCTAQSDNRYFDQYTDEGSLYILKNKKNKERFLFHFESGQFMNEKDQPIDIVDFFVKNNILMNLFVKLKQIRMKFSDVRYSGKNYYLLINDWSDFKDICSQSIDRSNQDVSTDFIEAVLEGDTFQYFDSDYHYDDFMVDDLNVKNIRKILKLIKSEKLAWEYYLEQKKLNNSTVSALEICIDDKENDQNEYEFRIFEEIREELVRAYNSASTSAQQYGVWKSVTQQILDFLSPKHISIKDIKTKTYKKDSKETTLLAIPLDRRIIIRCALARLTDIGYMEKLLDVIESYVRNYVDTDDDLLNFDLKISDRDYYVENKDYNEQVEYYLSEINIA